MNDMKNKDSKYPKLIASYLFHSLCLRPCPRVMYVCRVCTMARCTVCGPALPSHLHADGSTSATMGAFTAQKWANAINRVVICCFLIV